MTANQDFCPVVSFCVEELAEIVARIDEKHGALGDPLRNGDWSNIKKGSDFEAHYLKISERKPRSLKGKEWGEALSEYASENPFRKDNDQLNLRKLNART